MDNTVRLHNINIDTVFSLNGIRLVVISLRIIDIQHLISCICSRPEGITPSSQLFPTNGVSRMARATPTEISKTTTYRTSNCTNFLNFSIIHHDDLETTAIKKAKIRPYIHQ